MSYIYNRLNYEAVVFGFFKCGILSTATKVFDKCGILSATAKVFD